MEKIFQVPATIVKVSSMSNRVIRLQVDTQENLTDEQMTELMKLIEKYGHFCFLADDREIDSLDLINLPALKAKEENEKTPSTRLRNTLFVLWKQSGEQGDFEIFYRAKMEKFIEAIKEKLC